MDVEGNDVINPEDEGIEAVGGDEFMQENIEDLVAIQTAALAEVAKQEQLQEEAAQAQQSDRSRSRSRFVLNRTVP